MEILILLATLFVVWLFRKQLSKLFSRKAQTQPQGATQDDLDRPLSVYDMRGVNRYRRLYRFRKGIVSHVLAVLVVVGGVFLVFPEGSLDILLTYGKPLGLLLAAFAAAGYGRQQEEVQQSYTPTYVWLGVGAILALLALVTYLQIP